MGPITVNFDPVLLQIGHFSLRWFSIIVIIAVLSGLLYTVRAAKKAGVSTDNVTALALWGIPGGIVGSRLVHVIDQLDYYVANPGAIFGGAGQAIYGAILGGALAAWVVSRVKGIAFGAIADLAAPGLILAQAIGRVADILTGDALGAPTSLPWAFVYIHPDAMAPVGVPIHPSTLYELLWDLAVFGALLWLRPRLKPDGSLFAAYLAMYSLGRFFITFTRASDPFLFGLYQAQVIALLVLVVASAFLVLRHSRDARRRRPG